MKNGLKNVLSSFFAHKLTQQVRELYSSTLILNFAISAVTIFEPVFLYLLFIDKYGLSKTLQLIMLFYLGVYVIYFFIMPLGAKFARRFGYEHSIAFSTIFTALFYLSLFGASNDIRLLFVSIVMYAVWKTLYWPAYHSDFAHFSADGEQGRQISNLLALESGVFILGPLVGGLILEYYGFNSLFMLASVLMILSNIPMLLTKERFEPADFSYFDSYRRLFSKKRRRKLFSFLGFGEELIALTIWPIFIYLTVNDFLGLGVITSASIFITTIIFLYIGRATDKGNSKVVMKYGTMFYFFGWLLRILSRSIFGVFLLDSYSRVAKQSIAIPITAITYRKAQDTSVMKTILFFEMALVLGKILTMIAVLILLQFFVPGWNAIFILAALITLLYLLF
jgi:MFS family permease